MVESCFLQFCEGWMLENFNFITCMIDFSLKSNSFFIYFIDVYIRQEIISIICQLQC